MAIKSYKYKSKIATIIGFLAAFIVYVGKEEIAKLLPAEYAFLAGFIVIIAGYIVAQKTENKRVETAEQMVYETITQDNANPVTENITGDCDDDC